MHSICWKIWVCWVVNQVIYPTLHLTKDLGTHLTNPIVYTEVIDRALLDYNEI